MSKKKVLIFATAKGHGHKVIANNIAWYLEHAGYEISFGDLWEARPGKLIKYFDKFHTFVNTHMLWLWKFFYTNKIFTSLTLPLRVKVAAKYSALAKKFIDEHDPDVVLVTQAALAGAVVHLKKIRAYTKPLVVSFSDYHLHRYWLYDEIDYYLANIPEQKEEMIALGIPAEKIFVCGITLKPIVPIDKEEARAKHGISADEHLVLLAAGSLGIGLSIRNIRNLAEALQVQSRKRGIKIMLMVICGNNSKLYNELLSLQLPHVKVYPYVPMSDLYQIADVFLTKPGGLSVAQALACRLPILLTHLLPGQEEWNLNYLVRRGLVMGYVPIAGAELVAYKVLEEIQTRSFHQNLMQNPLIDELSPTDGKKIVRAFDSTIVKY